MRGDGDATEPWTTQRQPNPEPPQQPEAETQSPGGQPQTTDTHREQHLDMNQENATEPQGPGFNPQLEPKPPHWHTLTKSQRNHWRRRNHKKEPTTPSRGWGSLRGVRQGSVSRCPWGFGFSWWRSRNLREPAHGVG
jgi:hypothetical protein